MIKFSFLAVFFFQISSLFAIDIDTNLFNYDKNKVEFEFKDLSNLEKFIKENPQASDEELLKAYPDLNKMRSFYGYSLQNNTELASPGNFPSFWFTFILTAIGTYTLYGAVAGPISVGIVYFSAHKSKKETKKALWGWISGTIVGIAIWALFHL